MSTFVTLFATTPNMIAGYFGTQGVQLGLAAWLGLLTRDYWGI